jgi:hypothetical protein
MELGILQSRCMYYTIGFLGIFCIGLILVPPVFSDSAIEITPITCPSELDLGERGNIVYSVRNIGSERINLLDTDITLDRSVKMGTSSNFAPTRDIEPPFQIEPGSSLAFAGSFNSDKPGFHYVDIGITYSNGSNSTGGLKEQKELCKTKINPVEAETDSLSSIIPSAIFTVLLFPPIAGFVDYFAKRSFVKKDYESQQKVQQVNWLLQQVHSFVIKFNLPLAHFGAVARKHIERAQISKEENDLKSGYLNTILFLAKLIDFSRSIGGVYLFKTPDREPMARYYTHKILESLPFDRNDIEKIADDVAKRKKEDTMTVSIPATSLEELSDINYNSKYFSYFSSWIKSDHCKLSKEQAIENLRNLSSLLSEEADYIMQPGIFKIWEEEPKRQPEPEPNKEDDRVLQINDISPKYTRPNGEVFIFGKGFEENKYEFCLGKDEIRLTECKIEGRNDCTKIRIPKKIANDAYDIYAKPHTEGQEGRTTIGIVIHINDESSQPTVSLAEQAQNFWLQAVQNKPSQEQKTKISSEQPKTNQQQEQNSFTQNGIIEKMFSLSRQRLKDEYNRIVNTINADIDASKKKALTRI